jgi:tetratricopeptide (TPR) repeat protein
MNRLSRATFIWLGAVAVLFVVAVILRWDALQSIKKRTPDERVYASYAAAVVRSGPGAIGSLVNNYNANKGQWIYPPPTRVGYICLVAAVERITGASAERAGAWLSFAFSLLTFLVVAVIGWRYFNRWAVLCGLALLVVSPVELALAGRAWQDAMVGGLGALVLYLALEKAHRPNSLYWSLGFCLVGFFFLLIKESALIIFALCVLLLLAAAWRQGVLTWRSFLKIVLPSGLVVLLAYGLISWLTGGPEKVLQTYRHMNDGLQTNDYVYLYQSGPWYAIPLGFWVLGPVSTFLGLTAVLLVLLRGKMLEQEPGIGPWRSLAPTGLALFIVAFLAAATLPEGFKCLRYVSVVDGPLCLLGGLLFVYTIQVAARQFAPPRWRLAVGLGIAALLVICYGDFSRFRRVFVKDALDDLAVVRLVNFVVTDDDMPFGLSRPSWETEGRPGPTPIPQAYISKAQNYLAKSYALYKRGSYQEAIVAARQALAEKPDNADAWNNLGAAYNSLGQYREAAEALETALRSRPDFALARRNLRYSQDMMKRGSTNPPDPQEKNGR